MLLLDLALALEAALVAALVVVSAEREVLAVALEEWAESVLA